MNDFLTIYLVLTGIVTAWALSACMQIWLSGEEISFGEVIAIIVMTALFWFALLIAWICYVTWFDRKHIFKRKAH